MITRRDLVVATIVAVFVACTSLAAVGWAQSASGGKSILHSSVFNWDELKVATTGNGEKRFVCDSKTATLEKLECHITTLNPGESSHLPHKHWQEEIVILKEGELEALQGDERRHVAAGGIIFEGSNELHAVKNIGATPATYYVIQVAPARKPSAEE